MILTQYRVQIVYADHVQSFLAADPDAANVLRVAFEHLPSTITGKTCVRTVPVVYEVPDWRTTGG